MPALLLTSDLMVQSQLSGAAARTGMPVEVVSSPQALLAKAEREPPTAVILDLGHGGLDVDQLVPRLRTIAPAGTIVAFSPHVHKERLAGAAAAGCDIVLSRGALHAQMDELFKRLAG